MHVNLVPPLELRTHHAETIAHLRDRHLADPDVIALLLGGSIAHGFASEFADVDFVVVVAPEAYERRVAEGRLTEASLEGVTYPGGYTDGKFVDVGFLERVAASGSEPARFAFRDVRIVFDRSDSMMPLLDRIVAYPEDGVEQRVERFAAQLLAWRWYHGQGVEKDNRYVQLLARQKLVLFTCRVVLAENRLLYPYHKWMLRVTADAPRRPDDLMTQLDGLLAEPTAAFIDRHVRSVLEWAGIDHDDLNRRWGGFFLRDNETTWLTGDSPIDDL